LNPLKQYYPLCKEYVSAYLGLQKATHDKEVAIANELWDASYHLGSYDYHIVPAA
jgi:hypothetical protein